MRILIVHNRYQRTGGEDMVASNEAELLRTAGHEVIRYDVTNDQIDGFSAKLRAFKDVPYSKSSRIKFRQELQKTAPDIVHIHNYFPLLTPSIFHECNTQNVPVVHTLHNFRPMCMSSFLLRDGNICEKCISGSPIHGVRHRCYRGSLPGSIAVARMIRSQRRTGWMNTVDRFIALTQFARQKFIDGGFPAERIALKPNFIPDPNVYDPGTTRHGALYVGRLSEEKGLRTLIEAWREMETPLRIAGSGPLENELRTTAGDNVEFLGRIPSSQVYTEMARSAVLMMPSNWYEGFPVTMVEAFACGLPILASNLGSMAEIIEDGVTGNLFRPNDTGDLIRVSRSVLSKPDHLEAMSRHARRAYENTYTAEINTKLLIDIYDEAIKSSRMARGENAIGSSEHARSSNKAFGKPVQA